MSKQKITECTAPLDDLLQALVHAKAAATTMQPYQPKPIAAAEYENLESEANERRLIFEFDSFADAKQCDESPEYQAAKAATVTFVILARTSS